MPWALALIPTVAALLATPSLLWIEINNGRSCWLFDLNVRLPQVLPTPPGATAASIDPLRPIIERCLADVQERLIYRCQEVIRDKVTNFHPTSEDLDYPAKLQRTNTGAAEGVAEGVSRV